MCSETETMLAKKLSFFFFRGRIKAEYNLDWVQTQPTLNFKELAQTLSHPKFTHLGGVGSLVRKSDLDWVNFFLFFFFNKKYFFNSVLVKWFINHHTTYNNIKKFKLIITKFNIDHAMLFLNVTNFIYKIYQQFKTWNTSLQHFTTYDYFTIFLQIVNVVNFLLVFILVHHCHHFSINQ